MEDLNLEETVEEMIQRAQLDALSPRATLLGVAEAAEGNGVNSLLEDSGLPPLYAESRFTGRGNPSPVGFNR